ncbi:MAG TPA: hypothetical protein VMI47_03300 [Pseudolabrys sp.]|nr:hypothetical protein [Pseudolabrys sp.]
MPDVAAYRRTLRALLTPAERRTFAPLDSPQKIQCWLDRLPANFELDGDTTMSPRRMLQARIAHCAEAALFAAAALLYHGQPAWLMDLRALPSDQDHIVTLFRQRALWGAISKTNHAILRWRDPIYRSWRELAMSYAHEYCLPGGKKSLLAFSRPFSLTRYRPARWLTADENLHWLMDELDESPHIPVAPAWAMKMRRRSSAIELRAQDVVDWADPRKRGKRKKA